MTSTKTNKRLPQQFHSLSLDNNHNPLDHKNENLLFNPPLDYPEILLGPFQL
jgi:hypothetical protein